MHGSKAGVSITKFGSKTNLQHTEEVEMEKELVYRLERAIIDTARDIKERDYKLGILYELLSWLPERDYLTE